MSKKELLNTAISLLRTAKSNLNDSTYSASAQTIDPFISRLELVEHKDKIVDYLVGTVNDTLSRLNLPLSEQSNVRTMLARNLEDSGSN